MPHPWEWGTSRKGLRVVVAKVVLCWWSETECPILTFLAQQSHTILRHLLDNFGYNLHTFMFKIIKVNHANVPYLRAHSCHHNFGNDSCQKGDNSIYHSAIVTTLEN